MPEPGSAALDPPAGQRWVCRGCGMAAEWHPAAEGGYYCHCDCRSLHRAGMDFLGYADGYGPPALRAPARPPGTES